MKKQWIHLMAGLLLALLLPAAALGDTAMNHEPYVTTVYNERNGLPTGEANVVYQTSDHYIWIGSYGGLVRYDGSNFRNFSQEGLIPSSSIRAILEDREGRLWVGTNDAGLFVLEEGSFTRVQEAGEPVFLCIRAIAQGQDGTIYAASSSGLACVQDGILTPVEDHPLLTGQTVYSLGVDAYGRIWAALNDWQCAVVDGTQVAGIVTSEMIFPDGQQIYAVASDKEGRIYLGSYQNGVARVSFTGESLEPASFAAEVFSTGDVTIHNALSVTEGGHMLICGQLGFAWLDPEGQLRQFGEEAHAAALNSAVMDYEGNFWLASGNYGVIKYSMGCFDTPNPLAPGLADVAVNTIIKQGGRYYLGLDNGLLIFDENWQPVTNDLTQLLKGIRIRQVLAGSDGTVWLATYSNYGTICYDPSTDTNVYYSTDTGMDNCWTRTLLELQDGSIAAGTSDGFYILRDGAAQAYYGHAEGLGNTTILCFAQGDDGTLFIGTDGGGLYALKDGILTHHGTGEGLGEGVVLRILPDGDSLFVSAGSSLYHWENNQFRKLDQFGKAPGSIFDFYLRDGRLWLLQNNGILVVDKAQLLSGEYTDAVTHSFGHGLTGSLNANTWNHLAEDGRLYLSTRSGISVFGFRDVENTLPSGIINDIQVDGEVFEHPDVITLSSDTRRITIDFAMLSYTDTSQSRIAYWLEGLDVEETLVDGQKNGSISYTNLPGGEYTFHMRVFNPDLPQRAHTYQVSIVKEKKLAEQPLFWVLAALAFALVVAAVITCISHLRHQARIRRMHERQQELQAILVQSLQVFARVIDAKDPYTNGHSIRVAQYARELSRRIGLPEEEQERIYYIALLHDIGKIGIPDNILNKQGALTPEERAIIQTHPSVGGQVLKNFTALSDIDDGARYHHERYDGKGYCDGLKGKEIPLVARIIGVADSYDAMSSDRVYRPALSREKIVEELQSCSGTQFDPEIVPYMLEMIQDEVVPAKETPWQDVELKLG
ncbi:MAG: HD domain-containing protein [Clostridiales bacterium]|nr:HD domain-containing protein [Clostridiales bacterium]